MSPGASLSGAFTALATAGLAAAATTPPESQASSSLCWSCRQRWAKPGVGGGVRGGGFGPPPPHEGQISTLPPSNLRLSQSCQALSWATPESGPNFSAFKACSRRQVVTGSASAGHTAKQNPRARHGRQLPENRGHWQPPQTVPGLRLGTQSHLGRESLTNLARSRSRSGRRRAKARGSNKHSISEQLVTYLCKHMAYRYIPL